MTSSQAYHAMCALREARGDSLAFRAMCEDLFTHLDPYSDAFEVALRIYHFTYKYWHGLDSQIEALEGLEDDT